MNESSQVSHPGRLHRIAEVVASGGYSLLSRNKREPRQWWTGILTKEQAANWGRQEKVHKSLGQIAINDPTLGMEIFDQLRTSDDVSRRYYAARMVTVLFHASELDENEAVLSLLHDPDVDVRSPVDMLVRTSPMIGTDLDIHERSSHS